MLDTNSLLAFCPSSVCLCLSKGLMLGANTVLLTLTMASAGCKVLAAGPGTSALCPVQQSRASVGYWVGRYRLGLQPDHHPG